MKEENFVNFDKNVQSWYVATESRKIKKNRIKSFLLLNRRIAIYRDDSGNVHAIDAQCPHLGADLGQGKVQGNSIRCAFHHRIISSKGTCAGLKKTARVYPVQEKWGFIWIFNGPKPLFSLPEVSPKLTIKTPSAHIRCHPHLVIVNGLDAHHFDALHNFKSMTKSKLEVNPPFKVSLHLQGKPRSKLFQFLSGTFKKNIKSIFTTIGGNMAWVEVYSPVRFQMLFTGKPSSKKGCITNTFFFVSRK